MKPYDPAVDRERAHQVLRTLLSRGPVPFAPHPGEWDWWTFHTDPREITAWLIGARALAEVALDDGEVASFGVDQVGRYRAPASLVSVP